MANILHITNHGLHEWDVLPGLPDTGGQNVYVNHVADSMVQLGHRVTIANRGGYPHPVTGASRTGVVERHDGRARIVYLSDDRPEFVRKEDMAPQLPRLSDALAELMREETFDLMLSHYWDAAMLGILANRRIDSQVRHIWIPHSLGALKRRNVRPITWEKLRLDERIAVEHEILAHIDGVAATSAVITDSLIGDYGYHHPRYWLPAGVDPERYRPRPTEECPGAWQFLADALGADLAAVEGRPLIAEVSRTDVTKRKDVLIRAFAAVRARVPDALLAITIDGVQGALRDRLLNMIDDLELGDHVAVLGSVWEYLPCLYTIADVYCTPSVMEGFGMSAAEAAAGGVPVIASELVPFAVEYLLGTRPEIISLNGAGELKVGSGGIVAPPDSVPALAAALDLVLTDSDLRARLADAAHRITVPALTWDRLTTNLLGAIWPERKTGDG